MISNLIVRLFCIATLVVVGTGCNKEKDTVAFVIVKDADGRPVEGAYIKLYANLAYPTGDPSRLFREDLTNAKGEATFNYTDQFKQGQAGFAVLDILTYKDTLYAEGIIKVVEEETTEETVTMELIPQ